MTHPYESFGTHTRKDHLANLVETIANLPGAFAVWAASKEASFLHGRYVFSSWDVEELAKSEIISRLEADRDYLKMNVKGLQWGKKI
jgi:hypothetical protein